MSIPAMLCMLSNQMRFIRFKGCLEGHSKCSKKLKKRNLCRVQPSRNNCTVQDYRSFFFIALKRNFLVGFLGKHFWYRVLSFEGSKASTWFEWHKVLCIILVINFLVPATRLHLNGGLIDGPSRNTWKGILWKFCIFIVKQ